MPHFTPTSSSLASGSTVAGLRRPGPPPPPRRLLRAQAASAAGGGVRTSTSHPQQPTFYELLGIPAEVSTTFEDVRAAYRRMARRYHPDVSPTPEAAVEHTRRFIQVQEAYETLSDPGRCSSYDRALARGVCRLAFDPAARNVGSMYRRRQDRIAMERYKQMLPSKGKPFALQHCWKLLATSEKWKLREQEAPPKRGAFIQLDDDDSDVPNGGRNKERPDGNKKAKDKLKRQAEASSLRDKIDHMVKSNEMMVNKTLEAKMLMAEKKTQEKQARWQASKACCESFWRGLVRRACENYCVLSDLLLI